MIPKDPMILLSYVNTQLECDDIRRVRRSRGYREIGYGKAGRNELSLCSECKTAEKTVVYRGARGWCYHLQWLGGAVVGGAGK